MNWPRPSYALGIMAVVMLCSMFLLEQALRPPSKLMYQQLVAQSEASKDEIALLRIILTSVARAARDSRAINVNGEYNRKGLNVALVDFESVDRARLDLPKEGMLAFPPNVLLIDIKMFRSILLQTFNDALTFMMMSEEASALESAEDGALVGLKYGALSVQLRLLNLAHRESTDKQFGSMISSLLKDNALQEDFILPFVIPVSHELYHLRLANPSGLSEIEEETKADQFALMIAHQFFYKTTKKQTNRDILRKQLLVVGLRYFQDRILAEIFKNFRGVDADAIFPVLLHTKCNPYIASVPWPKRFNNPDAVAYGEQRGLPILSDDEVTKITNRLEAYRSRNHEHLLRRIVRFSEIIIDDPIFQGSITAFDLSHSLLKLYENKRANKDMFHRNDLPQPGRVQSMSVLNRLHAKTQKISAIGCDQNQCLMGIVGDGYVEILGQDNKIARLTMAQPSSVDGTAATIATLDEFLGQKRAEKIIKQFFADLKSCSVASSMATDKSYLITVRLMNTSGWIEVQATAY